MPVVISPEEVLYFRQPFSDAAKPASLTMTITNRNERPTLFTLKVTAPKLYSTNPRRGLIKPGESVNILIKLFGVHVEPLLPVKCKDKFLVQTIELSQEDLDRGYLYENVDNVWTRLYKLEESDSRPESRLKSRKFKVSWLPPQEATKGEPVVDEDPKSHQKDGSDMSGRPEAAQTDVGATTHDIDGPSNEGTITVEPPVDLDDQRSLLSATAHSPTHDQESSTFGVAQLHSMPNRLSSDNLQAHNATMIAENLHMMSMLKRAQEIEPIGSDGESGPQIPPRALAAGDGTLGIPFYRIGVPLWIVCILVLLLSLSLASGPLASTVDPVPLYQKGVPLWIVAITVTAVFLFTYIFL